MRHADPGVRDVRHGGWRRLARGGVAATVVAWQLATGSAIAQGVVDQSNDPAATTTYGCGTSGASLFQSFTPTATNLSAVMLRFRAGGSFPPGGASLAITLRGGSPTGTVLASAAANVAGPRSPGAHLLVTFPITPPVPLTPGQRYVIEQVSAAPAGTPAATVASWFGSDGDPYPRGQAYGCGGGAIEGRDYNFVTYTQPGLPAPVPTTAPAASPTPDWPPESVCRQIVGHVPRAAIDAALADPSRVPGYGQLERPGQPPGPYNRVRDRLSVRSLAVPYHPTHNGLVYRAGCP